MYRIVLFVLLNVALSLSCRAPPCHWSDATLAINYFDQVATKVINADRKAETFCYSQGCPNIMEIHAPNEYKLVIPGAGSMTYEIKVCNRVVQIISEYCQHSVTELRILPPYVNGYGGHYYFDSNDLVVGFPYKYDPTTGGGSCEEVNISTVTLYKGCNNCNEIY